MIALLLVAQIISGNGCPDWVPDWWCWITVSVWTALKHLAATDPIGVDALWLAIIFAVIVWSERNLERRRLR